MVCEHRVITNGGGSHERIGRERSRVGPGRHGGVDAALHLYHGAGAEPVFHPRLEAGVRAGPHRRLEVRECEHGVLGQEMSGMTVDLTFCAHMGRKVPHLRSERQVSSQRLPTTYHPVARPLASVYARSPPPAQARYVGRHHQCDARGHDPTARFVLYSSHFRDHGHAFDGCDWVVCWLDDASSWPSGVTVVELAEVAADGASPEDIALAQEIIACAKREGLGPKWLANPSA